MSERKGENKRRGGGRSDFLQRRAERRAKRRLAIDRAESSPEKISLLRRAGWSLRETGWAIQEKLFWPLADWARIVFDVIRWPFEHAFWAVREKVLWPLQDRVGRTDGPGARVPRAVTLGALCAFALGAVGAGALVAAGSDDPPAVPESTLVATSDVEEAETPPVTPIAARTEPEADLPALKGVRPSFGARSEAERAEARAAQRKLRAAADENESEAAGDTTNSATAAEVEAGDADNSDTAESLETSSSSDAGGEAGSDESAGDSPSASAANADLRLQRRRESPLDVAERFAMAFVSYEVGSSGRQIETVFKDTTDKDLFDSLVDRPPRQPNGGKVPKAQVVNVVGGPRKKNALEISVGLLRVDGISEVRLDMQRLGRGWVVKTVRG